ncbi:hypothetical protein WJ69_26300 [Burkholderia ubonensis]|uniref:Uncharacterized protein n=1 Tax=Burkholderia ubonensis TaxID=101571 RepID=A0ABD4E9N6_9BURK|nr:hypothetical protein WJ68_35960 [Burkholderia ubonensis]KVO03603.1 hypothetical protein WJ69_26300 [Burkholderia ubonensis]
MLRSIFQPLDALEKIVMALHAKLFCCGVQRLHVLNTEPILNFLRFPLVLGFVAGNEYFGFDVRKS